jgi:hypothetical protein
MKYIFIVVSILFSSVVMADAEDCSTRGRWSEGEQIERCWVTSVDAPTSKYIPSTAAVYGVIGGAVVAPFVTTMVPVMIVASGVSGAVMYVYVDSFKGPVYEANERKYKKFVDSKIAMVKAKFHRE